MLNLKEMNCQLVFIIYFIRCVMKKAHLSLENFSRRSVDLKYDFFYATRDSLSTCLLSNCHRFLTLYLIWLVLSAAISLCLSGLSLEPRSSARLSSRCTYSKFLLQPLLANLYQKELYPCLQNCLSLAVFTKFLLIFCKMKRSNIKAGELKAHKM